MSIAATTRRRPWVVTAGIALAVALAASVALLVLWKQHSHTSAGHPQPFSAAPAAEQARWEIKTVPAGAITHVGKDDRAFAEKRGKSVERVVRDIYDTQLLDPRDLPKVLRTTFTAAAAKSYERSGFGVPKGATDVKSTKRVARIGVDVAGARSASASVTIALVGRLKAQPLRLTQHSTLWMQRGDEGNWRVVGFDVSQGSPSGGHKPKGKHK